MSAVRTTFGAVLPAGTFEMVCLVSLDVLLLAALQAVPGLSQPYDACAGPHNHRRITHLQREIALTRGDISYTECGLPTWKEQFGTREAGLEELDRSYGIERATLEAVFRTPFSLALRLSENEYAQIRGNLVPEGREAMDRWRRWSDENPCFDARMLSLRPDEAAKDSTLPETCAVPIESWMFRDGWTLEPATFEWTKNSGGFGPPRETGDSPPQTRNEPGAMRRPLQQPTCGAQPAPIGRQIVATGLVLAPVLVAGALFIGFRRRD